MTGWSLQWFCRSKVPMVMRGVPFRPDGALGDVLNMAAALERLGYGPRTD